MSAKDNQEKSADNKKLEKDKGDEVVNPAGGTTRPITPEKKSKKISIKNADSDSIQSLSSVPSNQVIKKPKKKGTPIWGKIKTQNQELKVKFVTVGECSFNKLDGWFRLEPVTNANKASDEFGVDFKDHEYTVKLHPVGANPEYELIMTRKKRPATDLPKSGVIHVTYPFKGTTSQVAAEADSQINDEKSPLVTPNTFGAKKVTTSAVKKVRDEYPQDLRPGVAVADLDNEESGPVCYKMNPECKSELNTMLISWQKKSRKSLSKFSLVNPNIMNSCTLKKYYSQSKWDNTDQAYLHNSMVLIMLKTTRRLVKRTNSFIGILLDELRLVRRQTFCNFVKCLIAQQGILRCNNSLLTMQNRIHIYTNKAIESNVLLRTFKKRNVFTCSLASNFVTSNTETTQSSLNNVIRRIVEHIKPIQSICKDSISVEHLYIFLSSSDIKICRQSKHLSTNWCEKINILKYDDTSFEREIENNCNIIQFKNKLYNVPDISNQNNVLVTSYKNPKMENKYSFKRISSFRQKLLENYLKDIFTKFLKLLRQEIQKQPNYEYIFHFILLRFLGQIIYHETNSKSVPLHKSKKEFLQNNSECVKRYKSINKTFNFTENYFVGCIFMTIGDCIKSSNTSSQNMVPFSFKCDKRCNILKCIDREHNLQLEYNIPGQALTDNNSNCKAKGDTNNDEVHEASSSSSSSNEKKRGHRNIKPEDSSESIESSSKGSSASGKTSSSDDSRSSKKKKKKKKDKKDKKDKKEKKKKKKKEKKKKLSKKESKESNKSKESKKGKKKKDKKSKKSKKKKSKKNKKRSQSDDDVSATSSEYSVPQSQSSQQSSEISKNSSAESQSQSNRSHGPKQCECGKASQVQTKDEGWFKMCPCLSGAKLDQSKTQESKPATTKTAEPDKSKVKASEGDWFFSKCLAKIKSTFTSCSGPSLQPTTGTSTSDAKVSKCKRKTDTVIGKFRVVANYETGKLDIDVDKKSRKQLMEVLNQFAEEYDNKKKKKENEVK